MGTIVSFTQALSRRKAALAAAASAASVDQTARVELPEHLAKVPATLLRRASFTA